MNVKGIFFKVIILCCAVIIFGCDDDDDDMEPDTRMTAVVDGEGWEAQGFTATIMNEMINVTGLSSDGEAITITISSEQEGTYQLTETSDAVASYTPNASAVAFTTNSNEDTEGEVVVEEIDYQDSTITGTFTFSAYRPSDQEWVEVMDGEFVNVNFTSSVPSGPDDGDMSLDIDGETWIPPNVLAQSTPGFLVITGISDDGNRSFQITVNEGISAGTYNTTPSSSVTVSYFPTPTTNFVSESGSLNIDNHDTDAGEISGTFEVEMTDSMGSSISITNGSFDVSY